MTFVLFPPLIIYMDGHRGKEMEIFGKIFGKLPGKRQLSEPVNV
ncbi:hypothetical protein [Methanosarcina acetivorans]|nr:hypothetical protein [Methanosarcina acetivorans]